MPCYCLTGSILLSFFSQKCGIFATSCARALQNLKENPKKLMVYVHNKTWTPVRVAYCSAAVENTISKSRNGG